MCRFVAYSGHPILIEDLVYHPRHSLVDQSMHSEMLSQVFNADGFGVGWYVAGTDPTPCVVRSTTPVWAHGNLKNLARKLSSELIFAHIRAASPGLAVQVTNCHPFWNGRFMFMHNGAIEGFRTIRRRLQNSLSDSVWEKIEGNTDSEHAFALFLDLVGGADARPTASEMRAALVGTMTKLVSLCREAGASEAMALNFAVTDGETIVASRFAHGTTRSPATLFYSAGSRYESEENDCDMLDAHGDDIRAVMISSEPLTRHVDDWRPIEPNHTITVDDDLGIEIVPIEKGG